MKKYIVILLCLICVLVLMSCGAKKENVDNEIRMKNLTLDFDPNVWEYAYYESYMLEMEDDINKALKHKSMDVGLIFGYKQSESYLTTNELAKSVKEYLENMGINVYYDNLSDYNTYDTNDWKRLLYSTDDYEIYQRFMADGYDIYSFTIMYKNVEGLREAEKLFSNIVFNNTEKIQSEKNAKEKLIGEWDWIDNGYFVIEESKFYYFKDSSKDMNNVYYGTYEAQDGVATYGNGFVNGMHVIVHYEKRIIDGEVQEASGDGEFAFVENDDGSYTIKNLLTGGYGSINKVK